MGQMLAAMMHETPFQQIEVAANNTVANTKVVVIRFAVLTEESCYRSVVHVSCLSKRSFSIAFLWGILVQPLNYFQMPPRCSSHKCACDTTFRAICAQKLDDFQVAILGCAVHSERRAAFRSMYLTTSTAPLVAAASVEL